MDTWFKDVRYALRRLRKSPGFSAIVLLTLALGIGANSAIFSVVNTVLLRPFPYREPEKLVVVDHFYPSLNNLEAGASPPGFRDLRDKASIFDGVFVMNGWAPALTGKGGDPQRLTGTRASGLIFKTLGVAPILGRPFTPEEDVPGQEPRGRAELRVLAATVRRRALDRREADAAERRVVRRARRDARVVP